MVSKDLSKDTELSNNDITKCIHTVRERGGGREGGREGERERERER